MPIVTESEIRKLVYAFYARVREDPLLGPVFEARLADRWDTHLETMCDFWSGVLRASGRYRGDPIGAHARVPGLGAEHFDRWLELFATVAGEVLEPWQATDIVGRSQRMRLVLERGLPTQAG